MASNDVPERGLRRVWSWFRRTAPKLVPFLTLPLVAGCGRPLRNGGRQIVPGSVPGDDWSLDLDPCVENLAPEERRALADLWLEEAGEEHASIAVFSRLSLSLQAVGAPPELLRKAHRAALDEITHASLCYSLAGRYAGAPVAPAPMPELLASADRRDAARETARLAVESLEDGCLLEGASAIFAQGRLEKATDPAVRQALTIIARDEENHRRLAWDVVEWCIRTGGESVEAALQAAVRRLPARIRQHQEARGIGHDVLAAHGQWIDPKSQERFEELKAELHRNVETPAAAIH